MKSGLVMVMFLEVTFAIGATTLTDIMKFGSGNPISGTQSFSFAVGAPGDVNIRVYGLGPFINCNPINSSQPYSCNGMEDIRTTMSAPVSGLPNFRMQITFSGDYTIGSQGFVNRGLGPDAFCPAIGFDNCTLNLPQGIYSVTTNYFGSLTPVQNATVSPGPAEYWFVVVQGNTVQDNTVVPEPATMFVTALALGMLALVQSRRNVIVSRL